MSAVLTSCWTFHPTTASDFAASASFREPPPVWTVPRTVAIATFNVHDLFVVSTYRRERMDAIGDDLAALARASELDVAAFQEAWIESDAMRIVDRLRASGLEHWHYFKNGLAGSGLLVVSRFPIVEAFFHGFDEEGDLWRVWEADALGSKGVGLVRLDVGGQMLDVYDTHAIASYGGDATHADERLAQMREIRAFVAATPPSVPLVLAGDLNTAVGQREYAELVRADRFTDLVAFTRDLDHLLVPVDSTYAYDCESRERVFRYLELGDRRVPLSDHVGYVTRITIRPKDAR